MKSPNRLAQASILIFISLTSFYTVTRSPHFDQFRVVDIVLLLATGLCLGVAISLLVLRRP